MEDTDNGEIPTQKVETTTIAPPTSTMNVERPDDTSR